MKTKGGTFLTWGFCFTILDTVFSQTLHYNQRIICWTITADNYLEAIWLDEKSIDVDGLRNRRNWNGVDRICTNIGARVIAIEFLDGRSQPTGLLAESDAGHITDNSWRCINNRSSNWHRITYNDTGWVSARLFSKNGNVNAIRSDALWIGRKQGDQIRTFCRLLYGCADIENCVRDTITCTTATNERCERCKFHFGPVVQAFELEDHRTCHQLCSWRPDSRFCYPGTCGRVQTCRCASGFSGRNCLTMSQQPSIASCHARLERRDAFGKVDDFVDIPCEGQAPTFTNEIINEFKPDFNAFYHGPSVADFPVPYYVSGYKLGIIGAGVEIVHRRGSRTVVDTFNLDCARANNQHNPNQGIVSCHVPLSITSNIMHGDRFNLEIYAENGGFTSLHDYDRGEPPRRGPTHYYRGQRTALTSEVVFDFERPTHCGHSCGRNWLNIGDHYIKQREMSISWEGWVDSPSGIKKHEIEIFKLQPLGDELGYIPEPMLIEEVEGNSLELNLTEYKIGMYCVLLVLEDNSGTSETHGNIVMARRFFLLDDESKVEAVPTRSMRIQPVISNGGDQWVTSLRNELNVLWNGRFENQLHQRHKFLNRIRDHTHPPDILLEDRVGQPPSVRSMEEIPNINGISSYHISTIIGQNIDSRPESWIPVQNFQDETITLNPTWVDGDIIRVSIRANDVMNNSLEESMTVYVDSSPPIIEDIWLTSDGVTRLAVHDSLQLHEITLEFSAFDIHSGLHHVEWELYDSNNSSVIVGRGHLAAGATNCSNEDPGCYRIPKGDRFDSVFSFSPDRMELKIHTGSHDSDYYFLVTVTNNAKFKTSSRYELTIDTSPPRAGVVSDGPHGSPDLDFQQSLTLHAWWEGFFDKQSGVLFYAYVFSDHCLEDLSLEAEVNRTQETYGTYTGSGPGRFYVTVVAYNGASSPSPAVCSDGVTIDTTPPSVKGVVVENLWMREGLALDSEGDVWLINGQRERFLIENATASCRDNAIEITNLDIYPIQTSSSWDFNHFECDRIGAVDNVTYLGTENKLDIVIYGEDEESGIYDYEVGITETLYGYTTFKSTHGHQHYLDYHPGLGDGSTVFFHINAINKAGHEHRNIIGPIHVSAQAPVFDAELKLERRTHKGQVFLHSYWEKEAFDVSQVSKGFILDVAFALGSSPHRQDVMPFTSGNDLSVPEPVCQKTDPPTCVALNTQHLSTQLHSGHEYYLTVHVTGVTNRFTLLSSQPYVHHLGAPSPGIVVELPVNDEQDSVFEINQQSIDTTLRTHWFGFKHPSLPINYTIGLGTSPGADNIVLFHDVTEYQHTYVFTNLTLKSFERYYTTVIASAQYGETIVSSTGVIILPENEEISDFGVKDGIPCSMAIEYDGDLPGGIACGEDLDFLLSGTFYPVMWTLPSEIKHFLGSVKINLYDNSIGSNIIRSETIGISEHFYFVELDIKEHAHVYSCVTLCHFDGCFKPECTDGVRILSDPPAEPVINTASLDNSAPSIHLAWVKDTDFPLSYQWTILGLGKQLLPWHDIHKFDIQTLTDELLGYNALLPFPLSSPSCVTVALRTRSVVGITAESSHPLTGCETTSQKQLTVIDAVGEISSSFIASEVKLESYDFWKEPDRDFTPSDSLLSAVWPRRWHTQFHWILVSQTQTEHWSFRASDTQLKYTDFNTSFDEVLRYGITDNVFINIKDLHLTHGQRYHICVFAEESYIHFETFSQKVEEIDSCSNGIVAVVNPPSAGKVWMGGPHSAHSAQTDTGALNIYWSGFSEADELWQSEFNSTILYYQYCIGSFPGGIDIKDYTDVGEADMVAVSGISLAPGHRYYATVKATDMVGRTVTVSSSGVMIDTSPPTIHTPINVGSMYVAEIDQLRASWRGTFSDLESGILYYRWCIGTKPGHCDILSFRETEDSKAENIANITNTYDGKEFYFTVQGMNRVGLISQTISSAVVLDGSPPNVGQVLDILEDNICQDIDFQRQTDRFNAVWQSPTDPHSPVTSVFVSVGSCYKCGDVLGKSDTRQMNTLSLRHLSMRQGVHYFCTVEACNAAGLCSVSVSDGVVPDFTPPVLGNILDGISGQDRNYQSQRSTLSAHWTNMHDIHSGISHVYYWAGTTPGDKDIHNHTTLHTTERVTINLETLLPIGVIIYSSVEVFDHSGLSTLHISDGFVVDDSPPILHAVELNRFPGSNNREVQIWKHVLQVKWEAADDDSAIKEQYVSFRTRNNHQLDIPTFKVPGKQSVFVLTNVTLSEGEEYQVKVIACNRARLCTSGISNILKVDNSPPLDGAFAIETDHAASLTRHRDGFMTYERNGTDVFMNLSWVGFRDPHTEIRNFYVTIGTTYGGNDLSEESNYISLEVNPLEYHKDEGDLHMETIMVDNNFQDYDEIYLSIWAENQAGLLSNRLHGTFLMLPSSETHGSLHLVRRCEVVSCRGHCTCSHQANICKNINTCTEVTGNSSFSSISLNITPDPPIHEDLFNVSRLVTRSQSSLSASWKITGNGQIEPVLYEWSVGESGLPPGSGLFDSLREQVWREAGTEMSAIYTTSQTVLPDAHLVPGREYTFYIRAWYDSDTFSIHESDSVKSVSAPPQISRSARVMDLDCLDLTTDVDFTTNTDSIYVNWERVFMDMHGEIVMYRVNLGTYLGAADIASVIVQTGTHSCKINANFTEGVRYYASVEAFNEAHLSAIAYSDGFMVDLTPPEPGVVQHGLGTDSSRFISTLEGNGFTWRGFIDRGSGIYKYKVCLGSNKEGEDILPCTDVGLHTFYKLKETLNLGGVKSIYAKVYAYDKVGHISMPAETEIPVIIDKTPPETFSNMKTGPNLLQGLLGEFEVMEENEVHVQVTSPRGTAYQLRFHTCKPPMINYNNVFGFIRLGDVTHHFMVKGGSQAECHTQTFYGHAQADTDNITIGAEGRRNRFLLTEISYREMLHSSGTGGDATVHLSVHTTNNYTTVSASWRILDVESQILEYRWALGSTQGGTQLMRFVSTQQRSAGHTELHNVPHGTTMYATVIAVNGAGLTTTLKSQPYIIDHTPPHVCCLKDDQGSALRYINKKLFTMTWSPTDEESPLISCKYHMSSTTWQTNWIETDSLSSTLVDLEQENLENVELVTLSISCSNEAGLTGTLTAMLPVVLSPPDTSSLQLQILPQSLTLYPSRDAHQADTSSVLLGWTGVETTYGISYPQVSVTSSSNQEILPWTDVDVLASSFVKLSDLDLVTQTRYCIQFRLVNVANLPSKIYRANFTVETDPPIHSGAEPDVSWIDEQTVHINWEGLFSSYSSLTYVLLLGTNVGMNDALPWTETEQTSITVTGIDNSRLYYITLTAVNKAGLYNTRRFSFSYV